MVGPVWWQREDRLVGDETGAEMPPGREMRRLQLQVVEPRMERFCLPHSTGTSLLKVTHDLELARSNHPFLDPTSLDTVNHCLLLQIHPFP